MKLFGKKTKFVAEMLLKRKTEDLILVTILMDDEIGFVDGLEGHLAPELLEALDKNVIKDAVFVKGRTAKSPRIKCYLSDDPEVKESGTGPRLDLSAISLTGFEL